MGSECKDIWKVLRLYKVNVVAFHYERSHWHTCVYRLDLEAVMKNNVPSVQDFLKALQLTIEFESQLTKRFEKVYIKVVFACFDLT